MRPRCTRRCTRPHARGRAEPYFQGCRPPWWCALPDGTPDGPIAGASTRKKDGDSRVITDVRNVVLTKGTPLMTDTSPGAAPAYWPEERGPVGPRRHGAGWVLFAGIMVCLVGVLNVIYGIAAIGESRFFVADATYILSGLNTWGWIMLALGVSQVLAAYLIFNGSGFARWFGIAVAGLNAVGALMSISAYPFWSLAVFTLDILVIYGLAAYGGDPRIVK